jgi:hypothetical protein
VELITYVTTESTEATETTESGMLSQEDIEMKPWKYIGYRGYSNFIASDADFLLFRRFASSNTRIALMLQDQVALTEKELEELDRRYSRKDVEDVHNGCFRGDQEDRE